jgi:cytochrome c-type biogenesis protein CcmH/NrfG
MFMKCMLALAVSLSAGATLAANSADDEFLEKIRFIRYHAAAPADYARATRQLTQTVNQSDGPMLAALGRAYMRLQDYDNALGVLVAAVRVAPSNADAQADLALVSAMQGPDCAMSRAAYDRAVALNPGLADERHVQQARAICPG